MNFPNFLINTFLEKSSVALADLSSASLMVVVGEVPNTSINTSSEISEVCSVSIIPKEFALLLT